MRREGAAGRRREHEGHTRTPALFAIAGACFALADCAHEASCPGGLSNAGGLCRSSHQHVPEVAPPGFSPRVPWADVGRWAARIHRYQRLPTPGERRPLDTYETRFAFAHSMNAMHNKIHPIFADSYLSSIEGLPVDHPLNRPGSLVEGDWIRTLPPPDDAGIRTLVEIVLRGTDGAILGLGVVLSSGVDEFDAAVLEAVERASPFGAPPTATLSADGTMRMEWHFFRSLTVACSTINAKPFLFR
jgi:TonB family protein